MFTNDSSSLFNFWNITISQSDLNFINQIENQIVPSSVVFSNPLGASGNFFFGLSPSGLL